MPLIRIPTTKHTNYTKPLPQKNVENTKPLTRIDANSNAPTVLRQSARGCEVARPARTELPWVHIPQNNSPSPRRTRRGPGWGVEKLHSRLCNHRACRYSRSHAAAGNQRNATRTHFKIWLHSGIHRQIRRRRPTPPDARPAAAATFVR